VILLSDNDIIGKLAACDLLPAALVVLGTTTEEVYVLGTARYVLGVSGKKKARRFDEDTVGRIRGFLDSVQELPAPLPLGDLAALNEVPGIDPGEAILYAAAANYAEFLLATDDRNSLRALRAAGASCPGVVERLNGRVITFLQVIDRLIRHLGFDEVRARVAPVRHCDTGLRALFGSGLAATEANVLEGLASNFQHLRAEAGDLVVSE
jgi:hypothetical protein